MNNKEESVLGLVVVAGQHVLRWGLSEITKNSSQAIWSVFYELNLGPPEYRAIILTVAAQDKFGHLCAFSPPIIDVILLLHNHSSGGLIHESLSFEHVSEIQNVNTRSNITDFCFSTLAGA